MPLGKNVTAERNDWSGLLLGNGLSRHVWGNFGYPSLFDKARQDDVPGSLTGADRNLFETLDTKNFERVLADLAAAIRMAEALREDAKPYFDRYQSIQRALGNAVRSVHVNRKGIPDATYEAIGHVLQTQEYVFTTSYDLIVYWAMGAVSYVDLCDCFWGDEHSFDPANSDIPDHLTPIYFLHGALHLVVMGSGITRKLVQTSLRTLLDQFGHPLDGDKRARPLLITEGSSQHKLQAIEGNDYLAHALDQLGECDLPLVVFGSNLSEQDQHLVEALNRNPSRPIAVSIRKEGRSKKEIRTDKAGLRGSLDADPLVFFDAATHPLGLPTLSGS
ncbi:MAG TPA: DUF4917 family protein [Solirubrobacterales bacterium]|nr:DUF4917 family protein [Solirubrobacterales bacterium]